MTLDAIITRQKQIQKIIVAFSRGEVMETPAREALRKIGLSAKEVERLISAVKAGIIIPR